jgi:hypothetical protein
MDQITILKRDIATLKMQQTESVRLLKACKGHVGMLLGEDIESHLAEINGTYFNAMDYNFERLPGDQ